MIIGRCPGAAAAAAGAKGKVQQLIAGRPSSTPNQRNASHDLRRAAEPDLDLVFRARVRELHRRGPRLIYELLAELGSEHLLRVDIEQRTARYVGISDEALDLFNARRMPAVPFHLVQP